MQVSMGIKVHTVKQQKDLIASFRYSGKKD